MYTCIYVCVCMHVYKYIYIYKMYIMYISPSRPWEEGSDTPVAEKVREAYWPCTAGVGLDLGWEARAYTPGHKGAKWGHGVWLYLKSRVPRAVWAVEWLGPVASGLGVPDMIIFQNTRWVVGHDLCVGVLQQKPAFSRVSTCVSLKLAVMSEYLPSTNFPRSEVAVGWACSCLQQAEGTVQKETELVCGPCPLRRWVRVAWDRIKVTVWQGRHHLRPLVFQGKQLCRVAQSRSQEDAGRGHACPQRGRGMHAGRDLPAWVIDSPGICRSDTSQATDTAHHAGMSSHQLKCGRS